MPEERFGGVDGAQVSGRFHERSGASAPRLARFRFPYDQDQSYSFRRGLSGDVRSMNERYCRHAAEAETPNIAADVRASCPESIWAS